ncbi:hypothetical protein HJG60_009718 [Phyllostomus discolor]|uniref:Uncharacterized protein n=1 Tax=Phyllostomus discolor TaxID=89673 RepID=A0A834B362_9CHIR|nr:hypothetical protein HJG60_009718 [Phyllostomus discolor]
MGNFFPYGRASEESVIPREPPPVQLHFPAGLEKRPARQRVPGAGLDSEAQAGAEDLGVTGEPEGGASAVGNWAALCAALLQLNSSYLGYLQEPTFSATSGVTAVSRSRLKHAAPPPWPQLWDTRSSPDPSLSLQLELPPCVIPGGLTFCDLDSSLTLSGGVSSPQKWDACHLPLPVQSPD